MAETNGVDRDALGAPLAPGDLVTFYDVHQTCGRCFHCAVAKQPTRCPARKVYGITYAANDGLLGGWSEQIDLKPGVRVLRLPETLSADDVIGAPVKRLELAQRFGVDHTLSLEERSPRDRDEAVRDLTRGRGADVVIEVAGNPDAVPEGLRLPRDGGTYVVAGHYTDVGTTTLNFHTDVNRQHAQIRGMWGTEFGHVVRALALLARHRNRLPFADTTGGRHGLQDAGRALADAEAMRVPKAVILPNGENQ